MSTIHSFNINESIRRFVTRDQQLTAAHHILVTCLVDRILSPSVAANDIFQLCATLEYEARIQKYAEDLGKFLWDTAIAAPVLRDRIAELAVQINILSFGVLTPTDVAKVTATGFWNQFHTESERLIMTKFREVRNRRGDPAQEQEWVDINAFAASFVRHSSWESTKDKYLSIADAITTMSGLEVKFEDPDNFSSNANADIPAAAVWVLNAGTVLWHACRLK